MKRSLTFSAMLLAGVAATVLTAAAASPLAAIPIGRTMTYHVTTQSVTESGPQSASHMVSFTHTAPTTFTISVDGAPGVPVTIGAGGSMSVPPQMKDALSPFAQMGMLMRGAPKPIAPNAQWAANLPVPFEGQTDNVPVTMSVTQASANSATIEGTGSDATGIRPALREHDVTVSVNTMINLGPAYTIASANGKVSIVVHMGRTGARDKNFQSSWTVTPAGQ